ncbi:flavin reductase family protein [Reinekea thalattae]|uniref:Flavin reductase family protein n=1 Tax=Reinekea thalattae TaxID=2593301 RepID=A0A5C8ZBF4_9GAMM|nr:flavin reductase family protein [Reinekea thalattae]TXR54130.1 flavin reductase family protein [Reinekea thalattae]
MNFDFSQLQKPEIYRLFTHAIIPRPIAWVLTENESDNEDRSYNIAPYSFFTAVTSEPPVLVFSAGKKRDGSKKDTWQNIERSKRCVIHIANTDLAEPLNASAASLESGQSEIEHINLPITEQAGFVLPRVTSAPVAFECSLYEIHEIGDAPQGMIYCQVEAAYVADDVMHKDKPLIDFTKLQPLSKIGGEDYAALGEITTLKRPS